VMYVGGLTRLGIYVLRRRMHGKKQAFSTRSAMR